MLTHEGRYGLEPRFKGPFIVVQVYPDYGTVKLQTLSGEPLKSLTIAEAGVFLAAVLFIIDYFKKRKEEKEKEK